jgi:hypothetical protein
MLTRTVSRGRHSTKFRSALHADGGLHSGLLNGGWAYEEGYNAGVERYNRYNCFNGRAIKNSNVNIKALDVLYKSPEHLFS